MPDFVTAGRGFRAMLTDPHDGDTFRVLTDGGFDSRAEPWLRLYDTHAPELIMRLPPRGQAGGTETTDFVNDWLARSADRRFRWHLAVLAHLTTTIEPNERTTFRRYVATVWRRADWVRPWQDPPPAWGLSLNAAVATYLSGHPEWPTGE
jgi:hypothetical protein